MYHIFFIHSSVHGRLGCFHILAIVNSCSEHWGACILLGHVFLQIEAQEWDCRVICSSIFSFLRNLHTLLHSGYKVFS